MSATNLTRISSNLSNNLHNVKLTFRWPVLANGSAGNGRQVFRNMVSGTLTNYLEAGALAKVPPYNRLYFFSPHTYAAVPQGP